jgi:hypothetical protein
MAVEMMIECVVASGKHIGKNQQIEVIEGSPIITFVPGFYHNEKGPTETEEKIRWIYKNIHISLAPINITSSHSPR